MVLYIKKNKFASNIAYVQDFFLLLLQKVYSGMPVTQVTNSRSASISCRHMCLFMVFEVHKRLESFPLRTNGTNSL